jgi:rhodanese-related sulfurtransferase
MTTIYIIMAIAIFIFSVIFINRKSEDLSFTNVSVGELYQLMKDKKTELIDVRTQNEISQGIIGNPLLIELGVGMRKKMAILDKSKKYIIYCRSGRRSVVASNIMLKMGFKDVNNLVGGYNAWIKQN